MWTWWVPCRACIDEQHVAYRSVACAGARHFTGHLQLICPQSEACWLPFFAAQPTMHAPTLCRRSSTSCSRASPTLPRCAQICGFLFHLRTCVALSSLMCGPVQSFTQAAGPAACMLLRFPPLQVDAHLMPAAARHAYGPEQHCGVGVIRMLRAF